MLPVYDALEIVLRHCRPLPAVDATSMFCLGRVLAEDVASDLDSPPFDKAMMDGYAVCRGEILDGVVLPVAAEVSAGQIPPVLSPGRVIRIMTGAPIPAGADAVVRVEHTRILDDGRVRFEAGTVKPGQFIFPRGREMRAGDVVLRAGKELGPAELGLLATVGQPTVNVVASPRVAILATGDELVEARETPGPGQIRNSNRAMLLAQALRAGADAEYLGIVRDDASSLREAILEGIKSSILILSGGVSMGKRDLVPGVLADLGVQAHFHQVAMKPGKPLLFGTRDRTIVFGLPGNPVSSFCCFELFARPAIRALAGHAEPRPRWQEARLAEVYPYATDRPTYHPAVLENVAGVNHVRAIAWAGSPDLRALTQANALMLLPAGNHTHAAGARMPVLPF